MKALKQRQEGFAILRLHTPAGDITNEQLKVLSEIAAKYNDGKIHLTTRQGIEIHNIPEAEVDALVDHLIQNGINPKGVGKVVRGVTSCPGQTHCRFGTVNTKKIAAILHEKYLGVSTPDKLNIGISGCKNNCSSALTNDVGIVGRSINKEEGYSIYIGGRNGKMPRAGDLLEETTNEDRLLEVIDRIIKFYQDQGKAYRLREIISKKSGSETYKLFLE